MSLQDCIIEFRRFQNRGSETALEVPTVPGVPAAPLCDFTLETDIMRREIFFNEEDKKAYVRLLNTIHEIPIGAGLDLNKFGDALFVSENGDDGTAVKGDFSKPYATIVQAIDDAVTGDTIVQIGDQVVTQGGQGNLAKTSIDLIILGNLTSNLNEIMFDDLGSNLIMNIWCSGVIRLNSTPDTGVKMFELANTNSVLNCVATSWEAEDHISRVSAGKMYITGTLKATSQGFIHQSQGSGEWYHVGTIIQEQNLAPADKFLILNIVGKAPAKIDPLKLSLPELFIINK